MLNSRDINLLRPDVAANCRIWLKLCKAEGLNPLVVSTVRDDAYQAYLYAQGRTLPGSIVTKTFKPTFHWDKAGLAFDFCKNVKGHEYDDAAFFKACGAIGKKMGFTWGGDWTSFVDMPHLQWDGPDHKLTGTQIRNGIRPPDMPKYEVDTMTFEQFKEYMARYEAERRELPVSDWAAEDWKTATELRLTDGTMPQSPLTREQYAVILGRTMGRDE